MARYVNFYKEKSVVIRKHDNGDHSDWILEHEYKVVIEKYDGSLVTFPVLYEDYLADYTADEYMEEMEDEHVRIITDIDCPARDGLIEENITEWIINTEEDSYVESLAFVVSLLTRNNMWKDEYAKSIDINKIKEEWNL